jgi:hypothetical protein
MNLIILSCSSINWFLNYLLHLNLSHYVKSSNMLLDRQQNPNVSDFELAKLMWLLSQELCNN